MRLLFVIALLAGCNEGGLAQPSDLAARDLGLPDISDCRTAGCANGYYCAECLIQGGTIFSCLPNGSVC
jgi:hypothetical protein